jgi:8-oxo-dGTP pyrophosphatase MutT (NUDIX family)
LTNNRTVVRLREYYRDPDAPRAHGLLPAAFATVRNPAGQVLMVRRIDDGNRELPGGRVEVGETVAEAVIREVAEESGVDIALTGLNTPSPHRCGPMSTEASERRVPRCRST